MTRLTDEQLAELVEPSGSQGFGVWQAYLSKLFESAPAILAELRALRAVRDAAESLREARLHEESLSVGSEPISAAELRDYEAAVGTTCDRETALFAALDAARGEA